MSEQSDGGPGCLSLLVLVTICVFLHFQVRSQERTLGRIRKACALTGQYRSDAGIIFTDGLGERRCPDGSIYWTPENLGWKIPD